MIMIIMIIMFIHARKLVSVERRSDY